MTAAVMVGVACALLMQEGSPSPPGGTPVAVGPGVQAPKKIKHVRPEYPQEAARAGLSGVVLLQCVIDGQGAVVWTKVLSGVPPLTDAAQKAVRKWRYTPTLRNGVAVPVIMGVSVVFDQKPVFRLEDVLQSLRSGNEFIREAAAFWLGTARRSPRLAPSDVARIREALKPLAQDDDSERVRAAAARAIAELDAR